MTVDLTDAATAVLDAAVALLTEAGITPAARRYVSLQGGDWLPTKHCADCCDQIVVLPRDLTPIIPPSSVVNPQAIPAASQYAARFEVLWSFTVNVQADAARLQPGDPAVPWADLSQRNTHWAEAGLAMTAMQILARGLAKRTARELCVSANMPSRACKLVSASPWVEGGCGGCRVTIEVAL
jgi:hypothetical protein